MNNIKKNEMLPPVTALSPTDLVTVSISDLLKEMLNKSPVRGELVEP